MHDILGHDINEGGIEILQKVLKTAVDVATDQGRQMGEDCVGMAMIYDDSANRFASLDSDKYRQDFFNVIPAGQTRIFAGINN